MARHHIRHGLKEKALSMYLEGFRDADVSVATGISISSLKRLRRTDSLFSEVHIARGRPPLLTSLEVKFLCDSVRGDPKTTLSKLQTGLVGIHSTQASLSTIARTLHRESWYVKIMFTQVHVERNEQNRKIFRTLVEEQFRPEQLVFADLRHITPLTLGRSYMSLLPDHSHCEVSLRGKNYFILPALSLDGLLHLKVFEDEITCDNFRVFVQGLLPHMNEWPLPNSVLVADHESPQGVTNAIRKIVEERGARLLVLPTYSPDFNPIWFSFSSLKVWLGRPENQDRVDQALASEGDTAIDDRFWEAIHSITMKEAKTWYMRCGYTPE